MNDSNISRLIDTFISSLISVYSEYTILSVQDTRFNFNNNPIVMRNKCLTDLTPWNIGPRFREIYIRNHGYMLNFNICT